MRDFRLLASLLVCSLTLAACTGGNSPDVRDVALDASDAADAPSDTALDVPEDVSPCIGPPVEDLAMLGTPTADGLTYTGNNDVAPPNVEDSVQPEPSCNFRVVYERLFRYTLQTESALRVSTDNTGTDRTFDTVLFVTRAPCTLPLHSLACNDDDPYAPVSPHVTSSLLTTPVLPAGTTVLIALGGFYPAVGSSQMPDPNGTTGIFAMTVREVHPVAVGANCDPNGQTSICPPSTTCLADNVSSTHFTCRADGGSPGAACPSGTCNAPLMCDTQASRCYQTAADGATCDRLGFAASRCADGFSCVPSLRGPRTGICRANGSAALSACAMGNVCTGAGLVCRPNPGGGGTCLRSVPSGAACDTFDQICPDGEGCVPSEPGNTVGRCTANGTVPGSTCRAGTLECDGTMFCITGFYDRVCRTVGRTAGAACGPNGACSFDWQCVAPDPTRPYEGVCAPASTLGGVCVVASPACGSGLVCTNPSMPTLGRCVAAVSVGGACDIAGRTTRCATGTSCVREASSGNMGVCRAIGSVAGAACRPSAPRCDGALTCSAGPTGVCQAASVTGACSPRDDSIACPTGTVCAATGLDVGMCRTPATETEPNDSEPAGATPIATPGAVTASLAPYDLDCFDVNVAANGSLFAQLATFEGQCSASLVLDVYGAAGLLGSDSSSGPFGCPRVDGTGSTTSFGWARALAAGVYTVCVRQGSDRRAVNGYVLSLDAAAP